MPTVIERSELAYDGWIQVRVAHMRDEAGATFTREIEHHGNGVAVLPYDPERRMALVVRLARAPVLFVGETEALIEAPAGLVDKGEEPDAAARREAFEEVGVRLEALEPLGTLWTMPGISTERMSLYLGRYRAADRTGQGGGLDDEHENITVEERPLADLVRMAEVGEIQDMRTQTMLLRLRLGHPQLF